MGRQEERYIALEELRYVAVHRAVRRDLPPERDHAKNIRNILCTLYTLALFSHGDYLAQHASCLCAIDLSLWLQEWCSRTRVRDDGGSSHFGSVPLLL